LVALACWCYRRRQAQQLEMQQQNMQHNPNSGEMVIIQNPNYPTYGQQQTPYLGPTHN